MPESVHSAQFDPQTHEVVVSEQLGRYISPEDALNKIGRQRLLTGFYLTGNIGGLAVGLGLAGMAALGYSTEEARAYGVMIGSSIAVLETTLATINGTTLMNLSERSRAVKKLKYDELHKALRNL